VNWICQCRLPLARPLRSQRKVVYGSLGEMMDRKSETSRVRIEVLHTERFSYRRSINERLGILEVGKSTNTLWLHRV